MIRKLLLLSAVASVFILPQASFAKSRCIECHEKVTPGIVKQFLSGKMGKAGVDCSACHGSEHMTSTDYKKAKFPTPDTCKRCHPVQVQQFRAGKHDLGWIAFNAMPMVTHQPRAIVGPGYKGCSGCHKIGRKPPEVLAHYRYGNAQCDACHTRHKFSVEEAKSPRACSNCHMGFDHPQWEMYESSKHGIIWDIDGRKSGGRAPTCQFCHMPEGTHNVVTPWGFLALRIPTKENVLALIKVAPQLEKQLRSLAAKLPSGHYIDLDDDPQWTFDRAVILQGIGVLDENLQPTERLAVVLKARVVRGPKEFNKLRMAMKKRCYTCHSKPYIDSQFRAADEIVKAADHEFARAILTVKKLYDDGILKKPKGWKYAPDILHFYDSPSELDQKLYLIFLEYRQRAFQGAFHISNDYMHWYGWAPLKETVVEIQQKAKELRELHQLEKRE